MGLMLANVCIWNRTASMAEVGIWGILENIVGKSATVLHFCSIHYSSFNLNVVVTKFFKI